MMMWLKCTIHSEIFNQRFGRVFLSNINYTISFTQLFEQNCVLNWVANRNKTVSQIIFAHYCCCFFFLFRFLFLLCHQLDLHYYRLLVKLSRYKNMLIPLYFFFSSLGQHAACQRTEFICLCNDEIRHVTWSI